MDLINNLLFDNDISEDKKHRESRKSLDERLAEAKAERNRKKVYDGYSLDSILKSAEIEAESHNEDLYKHRQGNTDTNKSDYDI